MDIITKMENKDGFIRIINLSKHYIEGNQTRKVLNALTVNFNKGEFIAILGKSGSGKSTLLNLLSGIDLPDEGDITVDGTNLTRLSELERTLFRRREIGFIFQFFNLIQTLTVGENVLLPLELNGISQPEAKTRAANILESVGLLDRWDTYPDRLSGGEQQRVAISRALVHDPSIVLADEPTGNLDEETGKQILDMLDQLTRKSNKNLVMVTHSPEVIAYADRTFFLRDGKLAQSSN
jgi:putative ABC transport system ATP-binding protein